MSDKQSTKHSRFLSLVLRHEPEAAGVSLDEAGWVEVALLLDGCARVGRAITRPELEEIVATNDKKRFAFSEDGLRIRANQGHSIEVELGYQPQVPPEQLFHGTATRFLGSIYAQGLQKGERHHVHLSLDEKTAIQVGGRHGKVVVLVVRSGAMHAAGHPFFVSENGVWLVDHVPVEFLLFPQ